MKTMITCLSLHQEFCTPTECHSKIMQRHISNETYVAELFVHKVSAIIFSTYIITNNSYILCFYK